MDPQLNRCENLELHWQIFVTIVRISNLLWKSVLPRHVTQSGPILLRRQDLHMRSSLFWNVTQRRLVISYGRFGTIYLSHLQDWTAWLLKMRPIRCHETSGINYPVTRRVSPKERTPQPLCCKTQNSRVFRCLKLKCQHGSSVFKSTSADNGVVNHAQYAE
jgi:hypothetical protein